MGPPQTFQGPRYHLQTLSWKKDLILNTSCVLDTPALGLRGIQEVGTIIPIWKMREPRFGEGLNIAWLIGEEQAWGPRP